MEHHHIVWFLGQSGMVLQILIIGFSNLMLEIKEYYVLCERTTPLYQIKNTSVCVFSRFET